MKRLGLATLALMIGLGAWAALNPRDPHDVPSPDPNHTHADFAVWFNDLQIDFSRPEFMSGVSDDASSHDEAHEYLHQYLHLHDGNGNVLHSHKAGLTLRDFFTSLGMEFTTDCFRIDPDHAACTGDLGALLMYVNGKSMPVNPDYAFQDLDKILIILAASDEEVSEALAKMTDDACLYSLRCPWRGEPPTENCVADPAVPCVQ